MHQLSLYPVSEMTYTVSSGTLNSTIPYSLSIHFNGHFPGVPGLAGTRMSPFWILLPLRMTEVVSGNNWSYKTCKAPVKSSPQSNQLHIKHLAFNHYSTTLSATNIYHPVTITCSCLSVITAWRCIHTDIQYWYCNGTIWCQISPLSVYQVTPVS